MPVERPPDAPPTDSAAEAAMLNLLLWCPSLVGSLNLGPLLWCPEHRAIWQAMSRVWIRRPDLQAIPLDMHGSDDDLRGIIDWLSGTAICRQLHEDLCHGESIKSHHIENDGGWQWRCTGFRYWNVLQQAESPNRYDLEPWLSRLQRAADSRRLISSAHEMAVRAWRGDNEGAVAILNRVSRKEFARTDKNPRELEPTTIWSP